MKKKILFICTHNSARSQMAEGIVNALYPDKLLAKSAGTSATFVNPLAIKAMKMIGIDISHHRSKTINEFRNDNFDIVATVCDNARENCPFFPGKIIIHKSFPDPSMVMGSEEHKLAEFIKIRDEIRNWIEDEILKKV